MQRNPKQQTSDLPTVMRKVNCRLDRSLLKRVNWFARPSVLYPD